MNPVYESEFEYPCECITMHRINMQSAAGERIWNASQLSVFAVWQMFKLFGLLCSHTYQHTHTRHYNRQRFGVLSQIGDECTTAHRAEQQIKVVCK